METVKTTYTEASLARLLGVSRQRVNQLVRDGKIVESGWDEDRSGRYRFWTHEDAERIAQERNSRS